MGVFSMTEPLTVKSRSARKLPPLRIDWSLTGLFVAIVLLAMTVPTLIIGKDVFVLFNQPERPVVYYIFGNYGGVGIIQVMAILTSAIMLIMMAILLSRHFAHLYKREIADVITEMPYSRPQELTAGLSACAIQLSIPLLVNTGVMTGIMSQWAPEILKDMFRVFLQQWTGLMMLTVFSLLVLTLCGKFGDALSSMILLNIATAFIYFFMGMVWSGGDEILLHENLREIWLLFVPVADYFRPRSPSYPYIPLKHVLWCFVLLVVLYIIYCRRPAERAESRVGNYAHYRVIQMLSGVGGIAFFVVFLRAIFGINSNPWLEASDLFAIPMGGLLGIWISGLIGGKYMSSRRMMKRFRDSDTASEATATIKPIQRASDILWIWIASVAVYFLLIWLFVSVADSMQWKGGL